MKLLAFWRSLGVALIASILLASCAIPVRDSGSFDTEASWRGRLQVQVQSNPQQSISAAFELLGNAISGSLRLTSPLGTTLAEAQWTPQDAVWRTTTETRHFVSMDQMTEQLVGTPLPLAALFDWLQARPTPAQGWEADLQDLPQGRLRAQRVQPAPTAQLRIVLEQ